MKHFLLIAGFGLIFSSCGGDAQPAATKDTTTTDTVAMVPRNAPIDNGLLAKFTVTGSLPFEQDSTYLAALEPNEANKLTGAEASYLSFGFVTTEISYQDLICVDDFVMLDSLRKAGTYEDYAETADLGVTVYSEAYVAQKIELNDSTSILLWVIDHSTVEACPYGTGKVLYASVLRNNAVSSCTIIGEDDSSSDPPVWMTIQSFASLTADGYSVVKQVRSCGGETDEEGMELINDTMTDHLLEIDANGVWVEIPVVPSEN